MSVAVEGSQQGMGAARSGAILVLLLAFLIFLRLPTLSGTLYNPDEAIDSVIANKILDGGMPYRDAVDQRAPLTNYLYALIYYFAGRNNLFAIRVCLAGIMVLTTLVVYRLGWLAYGRGAALCACGLFILISHSFSEHDTFSFHTEWPMILFSSLGALLLLTGVIKSPGRAIWPLLAGFSYGLACLSKQPATLDAFAGGLFCIAMLFAPATYRRSLGQVCKTLVLLVLSFAVTIAGAMAYFWYNGALSDFIFYTWTFNTDYYVAVLPLTERLRLFDSHLRATPFQISLTLPVVLGTIIGLFSLSSTVSTHERTPVRLLFAIWAWTALVGSGLSGRTFPHYYIQIFPAWALAAGSALDFFFERYSEWVARRPPAETRLHRGLGWALLIAFFVLYAGPKIPRILARASLTFDRTLRAQSLQEHNSPALNAVSQYIAANSTPADRIFVWGFCTDIYTLSERDPASRFNYTTFPVGLLAWVNTEPDVDTSQWIVPGAMETLVDELRMNRPVFIVDTTPGNIRYFGKYPFSKFPILDDEIRANYSVDRDFPDTNGNAAIRLYRLKSPNAESTGVGASPINLP